MYLTKQRDLIRLVDGLIHWGAFVTLNLLSYQSVAPQQGKMQYTMAERRPPLKLGLLVSAHNKVR